jgi:3-oxoacyl-[acyl-carrier-protein] synthase II
MSENLNLADDERIVVTGLDIISPVGTGAASSWEAIKDGAHGIKPIAEARVAEHPFYKNIGVKVVAEAGFDEDTDELISANKREIDVNNMHRSHIMAWRTMYLAMRQARLIEPGSLSLHEDIDPYRVGSYMGTTFSGAAHLNEVDFGRVRPSDIFKYLPARVATAPAMTLGIHGHTAEVGAECASGATTVDLGISRLFKYRSGMPAKADIMVVGGADAPIVPANLNFFEALKHAVDPTADAEQASRPFDQNAKGLVMGEGAGAMVVETWEHAQKRGLKEEDILAEIAGFDSFTDGENKTLAGMEGTVKVIEQVMRMADIALGETVYINAHATSTVGGDKREAEAYKIAIANMGLDISDFWMTSTKGATGHTMGAAGAIEAAFSIMALREGVIPPALKLHYPIPEAEDFNLSPRQLSVLPSVEAAVSTSLGFGGTATALAFRKFRA